MHLVPFGEYVPLKSVFFFAAPLVQAVSNFSAGTQPTVLQLDGRPASTAICYEIVYPELVRRFVREGSQLLTTITNDAWFGRSSAPYQHFEQASLRAIEEGRYLARAANTGISGFVDPYGRVIAQSRLFEPLAMVGTVRYLTEATVYSRIGDLFAWLCVAIVLAALLSAWTAGRVKPKVGRAG
jgi:apolipoprotein N-acyltransferase